MTACPQSVEFGHPADEPTASYTINFKGKTVQNNQSTWCYEVRVEGDPALSHWVLGVFTECNLDLDKKIVSVTRNGVELEKESGYDTGNFHGVFGLKFDEGTSKEDGAVEYCLSLAGDYKETAVDVAVKGGPTAQAKENVLCGPSCEVVKPPLEQEQALNELLASIAAEEVALAHLINAEAEKIQKLAQMMEKKDITFAEVSSQQQAISKVLRIPIKKEILLQFKLEAILDFKEELEANDKN